MSRFREASKSEFHFQLIVFNLTQLSKRQQLDFINTWMSFCKHAKDPVFLLTADGRIISSNFAERTAVPPVTLEDILTPENAHIFRSMTENVMLSGQVFNFEAVIPAKENVPRIYDILFFPVYTVTGQQHKPVAVGVVARNITNLRQSEKAVSELQQMLRDQQITP